MVKYLCTNIILLFTLQKRGVIIICGADARDHRNIIFINLKYIFFNRIMNIGIDVQNEI